MKYLLDNFIKELKKLIIRHDLIWKEPKIIQNESEIELEFFSQTDCSRRLFIIDNTHNIQYLYCGIPKFKGMIFDSGEHTSEKFIELWKRLNE